MAHRNHPDHSPDPPLGAGNQPADTGPVSDSQAQYERGAVASPRGEAPEATPAPFNLPSFGAHISPAQSKAIDLLSDVNLNVKIELGRTRMLVEDVLRLGEGAVVELDKLAGDPVDIYVNDRPIARGEVLVLNDNFCVRINEIIQNPVDGQVPKAARKAS